MSVRRTPGDGTLSVRRRAFVLGLCLLVAYTGTTACARIGYSLRPETIRNGRPQSIRLAVGTFVDNRPKKEVDIFELERLVGDEASYYTDYGTMDVGAAVSNVVVRHLMFSGAFPEVARVELDQDQPMDYLRLEIKQLAGQFDAVLLGRVTHLWGFDGYNADGDHRIVEAQAHLVDLKIIRCRDLKLIWSGEATANLREIDSLRKGNEYAMANDMLREAVNKMVADLNRGRLPR